MREDVTVYYITGKQLGPLSVPESWCEECDLTVRSVQSALKEVDPESILTFAAKPWMRHAVSALLKGGWHPPVVVIDGKVHSQGVVPRADELVRVVRPVLAARMTDGDDGGGEDPYQSLDYSKHAGVEDFDCRR